MVPPIPVTIVPSKQAAKHADYFMMAISAMNNQEFEAATWTEKEYSQSKAKTPSSQPIVFLGKGAEAEKSISQMRKKYDHLGMQILSYGKRVILYVNPISLTPAGYSELKDIAIKHDVLLEDPNTVRLENLTSWKMWLDPRNSLPPNINTKLFDNGIITDQRYQCLIKIFVDDYMHVLLG